jgi:hypothetical protein
LVEIVEAPKPKETGRVTTQELRRLIEAIPNARRNMGGSSRDRQPATSDHIFRPKPQNPTALELAPERYLMIMPRVEAS